MQNWSMNMAVKILPSVLKMSAKLITSIILSNMSMGGKNIVVILSFLIVVIGATKFDGIKKIRHPIIKYIYDDNWTLLINNRLIGGINKNNEANSPNIIVAISVFQIKFRLFWFSKRG